MYRCRSPGLHERTGGRADAACRPVTTWRLALTGQAAAERRLRGTESRGLEYRYGSGRDSRLVDLDDWKQSEHHRAGRAVRR